METNKIEGDREPGESLERDREITACRLFRSTVLLSKSIDLISFLLLSSPEFGIMLST